VEDEKDLLVYQALDIQPTYVLLKDLKIPLTLMAGWKALW
jgi:hypothetical protein